MSEHVWADWQQKAQQVGWPFWAGLVFFFWTVIGLVCLFEYSVKWLHDENALPIEKLEVKGHEEYVIPSDVLEALRPQMRQSFFTLDVNQVQQRVESLAWVYRVSVRKEWPNRLKIYVTEQAPAVHWNGDFLLNTQGDVFQADLSRLQQALAKLYGPEGDEKEALKIYSDLTELISLYGLAINEMALSERHALSLTLDNGINVNLGREDWLNRSKRFLDLLPKLAAKHDIEYVDLRYDTGFALGVKEEQETKTK
ncbi:FtsQ-type POTRA domain-containing protein [Catenovulum sp. SM1970]|uniref:cell division protein FtsQ/DivIB n=1 Tax=Marinifaba aquimaris TaxID=2741323 RepID=UPI00157185CB|nr:cell division protein FtsQ/DivIB [Marinifaba aquimaris]NTS76584.1 FtsQ-type POTRA domain-containing protein [Marinifaba aquimaris]